MHSNVLATVGAAAVLVPGIQARLGSAWWGAAPECAQACLSSVYSSEATATTWPEPGRYCTSDSAGPMETCIASGCTSTPSAASSLSSLHSSLCDAYESCTDDPSAVYTLTRPTAGPYGGTGSPRGHGGFWGSYTGATGTGELVATVTGCPSGMPYSGYGGPGGYGGRGPWGAERPDDVFWGWGYGWSDLTTSTYTTESPDGAKTEVVVAEAVLDGETTSSTVSALGATETDADSDSDGDSDGDDDGDADDDNQSSSGGRGVGDAGIVGAALGVVLAIAAAL